MKNKKVQYLGVGKTRKNKWKFYYENLWNETFYGRGCSIVAIGIRLFTNEVGLCLFNFAFGIRKE